MSKTSKLRDLHRQSIEAIRDRGAFCRGCGLTSKTGKDHRPDCTVFPSPIMCADCDAIRFPSEKTPVWQFQPATRTYHCPEHARIRVVTGPSWHIRPQGGTVAP